MGARNRSGNHGRSGTLARASRCCAHRQSYHTLAAQTGLIARRDYEGARSLIGRIQEGLAGEVNDDVKAGLPFDLVHIHAINGRVELALGLAKNATEDRHNRVLALWAIHAARGDNKGQAQHRAQALAAVAAEPPGKVRSSTLTRFVAMELAGGIPGPLREMLEALERATPAARQQDLYVQSSLALLGGALEDSEVLTRALNSSVPEARAIAEAFTAEGEQRFTDAAAAWQRARDFAGDGRYRPVESFFLARVLRAADDHQGVVDACDDVIDPRIMETWSWGTSVGPCLLWSGDATASLDQVDRARSFYKRLVRLRTKAPEDDPLLTAARASLTRLSVQP